eukprot:COSAG02_NODE_141_length_34311_cov_54.733135_2_plen_175_part_00
MQVEGDEKKAKTSARATRRQPAAAAAAASITTDKLGEFERRVDIVASFLVLNHEARSFDDTVPKLMPRTAALYGGLGGMEKDLPSYKSAMNSVGYAKKKLLEGFQSVCWEPTSAAAAADSAPPASQSPEPPGQSPASTPARARMLAKMQRCRTKAKTKGQVVVRRDKKVADLQW